MGTKMTGISRSIVGSGSFMSPQLRTVGKQKFPESLQLYLNNDYIDISVIEGGITSWVKNGNDITYPKLD